MDIAMQRTVNLVVYTLALAWVVVARLNWHGGESQTVTLFKLCAIPIGLVIGSIAYNWILDRTEHTEPKGFEVKRREK